MQFKLTETEILELSDMYGEQDAELVILDVLPDAYGDDMIRGRRLISPVPTARLRDLGLAFQAYADAVDAQAYCARNDNDSGSWDAWRKAVTPDEAD